MKILKLSATLSLLAAITASAFAAAPTEASKPMPDMPGMAAPKKVEAKPYPFATSVVSGAALPSQPVVLVQDGFEVKVSSKDEEAAFRKDPAPYLAKIKKAYAEAKPYPLATCLVCDMKLEGDELVFVYEGRQFKVCKDEEDCYALFQKDPAKYVKKWDDAAQAAKPAAK